VKSIRHRKGGIKRTDGLLRSTIYERLYRMRVHLHWHATIHQHLYTLKSNKCSLKYRYPPKRLRGVFKRMLHVFHDCLLTNSFFEEHGSASRAELSRCRPSSACCARSRCSRRSSAKRVGLDWAAAAISGSVWARNLSEKLKKARNNSHAPLVIVS
jgi:hypothetical protein